MKIQHTGFTVSDLDRSIAFYESLGMRCTMRVRRDEKFIGDIVGMEGADISIAYLSFPDQDEFLELLQYHYPRYEQAWGADVTARPCNGHICFQMSIREWYEHPVAADLPWVGQAGIPDGPNKGCTSVYVRDPDGFTVEFFIK